MDIKIPQPNIKEVSFEEFEKTFFEALKPAVSNKVIFYKLFSDGVALSFSFDNFIIFTKESYENIKQKFPNSEKDAEVIIEDEDIHPSITKFINHYTYERGIEER